MRNIITLALVLLYTSTQAQFKIGLGYSPMNQDNKNPISWNEITQFPGFEFGRPLGETLSEAQLQEIEDRGDGTLDALHFNIGYDLPFARGVKASAGFTADLNTYIQVSGENTYDAVAFNPSVGIYADFGLRLDVGLQRFANVTNWYLDISGRIVDFGDNALYLYSRYQRANPYTDRLDGVFAIGGAPSTLESAAVGLRVKL